MTLLYEAALKTTTELDENDSRPRPINPTAGVQRRQNLGKAVFVKDETKPAGGIWVVQSDDEKANAGLLGHDVVVLSTPGSGSSANGNGNDNGQSNASGSGDSMQPGSAQSHITQQEPSTIDLANNQLQSQNQPGNGNQTVPDLLQNFQMSSTNVNPQLNFDDLLGGGDGYNNSNSGGYNNGMNAAGNGFGSGSVGGVGFGTGPPGFDFAGTNGGMGTVPMVCILTSS
jgi:hypothetical protein